MDWLKTWLIAAAGAAIIIAVWFGRLPSLRRARTASDGRPNMTWWMTLGVAVIVTAYTANRAPGYL